MRVLGIITTVLAAAVVVVVAVTGVRSTPDIKRYVKMRSM